MSFSEIFNLLLGGTVITLIVALATMKATVRKANAEAEKAKADADKARAEAEAVRITNTENATRILMENIVKPLKEELHATRQELHATREKLSANEELMAGMQKELASTKRAVSRLSRAVESAKNCPHTDDCVVLYKLRNNKKESDGADTDIFDIREDRHDVDGDQVDNNTDNPGESGGSDNIRGQPP